MNSTTRKQIQAIMVSELGLDAENFRQGERIVFRPFIIRKDGTCIARETFFYRHGGTTQKWADRVRSAVEAAGFKFEQVEAYERYNTWPKQSYWEVTFRIS